MFVHANAFKNICIHKNAFKNICIYKYFLKTTTYTNVYENIICFFHYEYFHTCLHTHTYDCTSVIFPGIHHI